MPIRERQSPKQNLLKEFVCHCGVTMLSRAPHREWCDRCRKILSNRQSRDSYRRNYGRRGPMVRATKDPRPEPRPKAPRPKSEEFARLDALLGNPWSTAGFGVRACDGVYGVAEVA